MFDALDRFQIELPSWGFAQTGTRFGKFLDPTAASTLEEKFQDAGAVHAVTGCCPTVAVHVLWDFASGLSDVEQALDVATRHGVQIGSINPNLFEDQRYKYGSITSSDAEVRRVATRHLLDCVDLAKQTGSRDVSIWLADGSNYPGSADIRRRRRYRHQATDAPRHPALAAALAAALTLGAPLDLPAQALRESIAAGASFENFSFRNHEAVGLEQVTLITTPLVVSIPLRGVRFDLTGALARGELTRSDGSHAAFTGPTDTRIALTLPVGDRIAEVTAFGVVPTGAGISTRSAADVAGVIAADLLPFAISHWGSGGGAGVAAAVRQPLGMAQVAFGASYMVTQAHDAADHVGLVDYRMGDQLGLQLGVESPLGRRGVASFDLRFQRSADDQLASSNLYRAGNRFQALGSYAFSLGSASSGVLYAAGHHRQRGEALLDTSRDSPAQDLVLAGAGLRLPVRGSTMFLPQVDARAYRTEDGAGHGYLGAATAAVEFNRGLMRVEPRVRGQMGRVLMGGGRSSGVIGLELGVTVSARRQL